MARNFKIPPHKSIGLVTNQADIGLMIKVMRNKQSIRIDAAAELCGVSVALLSALESNSGRSVGVDKILNILDQLGLALVITDKSRARDILRGIDEANDGILHIANLFDVDLDDALRAVDGAGPDTDIPMLIAKLKSRNG